MNQIRKIDLFFGWLARQYMKLGYKPIWGPWGYFDPKEGGNTA